MFPRHTTVIYDGLFLTGLTRCNQLKIIVNAMKQDIHPQYYTKAIVICSCGAKHSIGSTKEKMTIEICSECHPFYTGKENLIDTAGRVEKFKSRQRKAQETLRRSSGQAKTKTKRSSNVKKAATKKKTTPRRSSVQTAKKPVTKKKIAKK